MKFGSIDAFVLTCSASMNNEVGFVFNTHEFWFRKSIPKINGAGKFDSSTTKHSCLNTVLLNLIAVGDMPLVGSGCPLALTRFTSVGRMFLFAKFSCTRDFIAPVSMSATVSCPLMLTSAISRLPVSFPSDEMTFFFSLVFCQFRHTPLDRLY